jgi:hypothetical protein
MPVTKDRDAWMKEAREEAERQWGWPGLLDDDDNPAVFETAFRNGGDPKSVVAELGIELELMDPGPWSPGRRG